MVDCALLRETWNEDGSAYSIIVVEASSWRATRENKELPLRTNSIGKYCQIAIPVFYYARKWRYKVVFSIYELEKF